MKERKVFDGIMSTVNIYKPTTQAAKGISHNNIEYTTRVNKIIQPCNLSDEYK